MDYFSHSWLPFMYLYGLGGLLFIAGIFITIKSGSLNPNKLSHWRWFWTLIFGLVWYMCIHASLNLAGLGFVNFAFILMASVIIVSIFGAYWVMNSKTD
tara:strand:+ start:2247 stop:2543 length:297 start_codon:yes stop_codon:yes gene_type:complete